MNKDYKNHLFSKEQRTKPIQQNFLSTIISGIGSKRL